MLRHMPGAVVQSWYHQPSQVERALGIWAVAAGATQADHDFLVPTRVRPYWGLHVVMTGAVAFRSDDSGWHHLRAGDAFAAFPGVAHEFRNLTDEEPARRAWIEYDGPAARDVTAHLAVTAERPWRRGIPVEPFAELVQTVGDVFDPEVPGLGATSYLLAFVAALEARNLPSTPTDRWLDHGRTLMDVYFGDGITVDAVARQLRVDRVHFTMQFTARYGEGPGSYLRRRRLGRARELLRETEHTVTEIAHAVGYAGLYSFSHSYRSHFGVAPSADRRGGPAPT